MKKQKKKPDICEFYLSNFIAGIPPDDFLKILQSEHKILEIMKRNELNILKIKKDADKNSKLYDFCKNKEGVKIKCICNYYQKLSDDETEEKNINRKITNANDCMNVKKFFRLLNFNQHIFCCNFCHENMFSEWRQGLVELNAKGK